jgi:hypothetical protein
MSLVLDSQVAKARIRDPKRRVGPRPPMCSATSCTPSKFFQRLTDNSARNKRLTYRRFGPHLDPMPSLDPTWTPIHYWYSTCFSCARARLHAFSIVLNLEERRDNNFFGLLPHTLARLAQFAPYGGWNQDGPINTSASGRIYPAVERANVSNGRFASKWISGVNRRAGHDDQNFGRTC